MGVLLVIGGRGRGGRGRTISNPVTDDFQRASLGGNWTVHLGNAAIVGSADWGASAASGIHISSYTASTPGANQYAEARTANGLDALMQHQIYVRRRTADGARYAFHYDAEATPSPEWQIKYDGVATEFTWNLDTSGVAAPVAGDVLRVEARGNGATVTVRGYHNGILICEGTDSTVDRITSGSPGLVCRAQIGETLSYPSPVFADFSAGTLLL